jgi:hypothetical protein
MITSYTCPKCGKVHEADVVDGRVTDRVWVCCYCQLCLNCCPGHSWDMKDGRPIHPWRKD